MGASVSEELVKTNCFEAGGVYQANEDYTTFTACGGLSRSEMCERFPGYSLPPEVTEEGWYRRPPASTSGRESDDEARARARGVAEELLAEAAALGEDRKDRQNDRKDHNVVLVAHYDFLCALLDALVIPTTAHSGAFANWKHYNTGISVVDITAGPGWSSVAMHAMNAVGHLTHRPEELLSGFAL